MQYSSGILNYVPSGQIVGKTWQMKNPCVPLERRVPGGRAPSVPLERWKDAGIFFTHHSFRWNVKNKNSFSMVNLVAEFKKNDYWYSDKLFELIE